MTNHTCTAQCEGGPHDATADDCDRCARLEREVAQARCAALEEAADILSTNRGFGWPDSGSQIVANINASAIRALAEGGGE
jgi:hypothetical protein